MKPASNQLLFQPLKLANLQLPNRIVMPPMTRTRAGEQGIPNNLIES
ncbi:MAG: hypothetical protein HC786_06470 [Richelia sp. CSU_2_1]|nr:hypothetical protein [Microcoleus sp. SU_5_6]NJR21833.1 hypothetical protein [Richelia sp. CSU_2_1]